MPRRPLHAFLAWALLAGAAEPASACTSFLCQRDGTLLFGKSYDWHTPDGLVLINKRGVDKQALVLQPGVTPARWTSRHASVTFNQYGREFPAGGMNEAGLVVEVMWLESTATPEADPKPAVNELQWIQYLLDTAGTLAEAITQAEKVWVLRAYGKAHYLACDRTGACAAFEYLGGKLTVLQGKDLGVPVLTNHTHAESAAFLKKHRGFGGEDPIPQGEGSLARYARAASLLPTTEPFEILRRVAIKDYTKWNIVYDLIDRTVTFRTSQEPREKKVDLMAFDLSCQSPVQALDIQHPGPSGSPSDVTRAFTPYTKERNRDLLRRSLKPIADKLPPGAVEILTLYPEGLRCGASQTDPGR